MDWQIKTVIYLNKLGRGKIDHSLRFISSIRFLAVFWLVVSIAAYAARPESGLMLISQIMLVAGLHFIITEAIFKHLLRIFFKSRKRPYLEYPNKIKAIGRKFSDASFPSSHMATTCAMVYVLAYSFPIILPLGFLFVLFMAFSRLHNGMHYPVDVICGSLLGIAYGMVAVNLVL